MASGFPRNCASFPREVGPTALNTTSKDRRNTKDGTPRRPPGRPQTVSTEQLLDRGIREYVVGDQGLPAGIKAGAVAGARRDE